MQENGFKMRLDAREFHLVEFHFHEASEHWINETQFPMELHVVFQNAAARAVLGVMIDLPARNRPATHAGLIDESKLPEVVGQGNPIDENDFVKFVELNPAKWLPKGNDAKDYFRYEGSLTTAEYDENVSWLVFKRAIVLPKGDIKLLRQFFGLPARNPQPANRRYVLTTD